MTFDWFGGIYEESSWTRFIAFWQIRDFQNRRNTAFATWLEHVVDELQARYADTQHQLCIQPNQIAGSQLFLRVAIPSISQTQTVDLTLYHYDTLTKARVNPILWVLNQLKWLEAHPAPSEQSA